MTTPVETTTATITIKPAWINVWFHALFTKPGIEMDGHAHQLNWGTNDVEIPISTERIGVYFHYRGKEKQRLALSEKLLDHKIGSRIIARLGVRNSASFNIIEP